MVWDYLCEVWSRRYVSLTFFIARPSAEGTSDVVKEPISEMLVEWTWAQPGCRPEGEGLRNGGQDGHGHEGVQDRPRLWRRVQSSLGPCVASSPGL